MRAHSAVRLFLSYAPEDEAFAEMFQQHMTPLSRTRKVVIWSARQPGTVDPSRETAEEIERASLFVPLLSASYLASDDLREQELMKALSFELQGRLRVAPVLVRACDWKSSELGQAKFLGGDAPIAAPANDDAWMRVVVALRALLDEDAPQVTAPPVVMESSARMASGEWRALTPSARAVLSAATVLAEASQAAEIGVAHLLGGLFSGLGGGTARLLDELGVTWSWLRAQAQGDRWPDDPLPAHKDAPRDTLVSPAASEILERAQAIAGRRSSPTIGARDILAAALTARGEPLREAIVAHGVFGEVVGEAGRTQIYVKHVTHPWHLPVEAFTIPTTAGYSDAPSGELWRALLAAVGRGGAALTEALAPACRKEIHPHRPALVALPVATRDEIVPCAVFLATSGSTDDGAGTAAARIIEEAARARLDSIAVSLLGSVAGGLSSVAVVEAMVPALLKVAAERDAPRVVVLTTLTPEAVARAVAIGRSSKAFPATSGSPLTEVEPALGARSVGPAATLSFETKPGLPSDVVAPSGPATPLPFETPPQLPVDLPSTKPPSLPLPSAARLAIHGATITLEVAGAEVWRREDGPVWADLQLPGADGAVGLESALPRLHEWDEMQTAAFGKALGEALFGEEPGARVLRALAVPAGSTLRLSLDLDDDAAAVPWEYLHVDGAFLIEQRVSMIRHVRHERARPLRPVKLRSIVFAWANPKGTEEYTSEGHVQQTRKALRDAGADVHEVSLCTPSTLREALEQPGVDALHYLGHGQMLDGMRGTLVVHAEPGSSDLRALMTADELGTMIGTAEAKLVFLGACHSGQVPPRAQLNSLAAEIARRTGVPVVAMQVAVPRDFATAFAAHLYAKLREVPDVERAVYLARQVEHEGRHAFGIPVLYADVNAAEASVDLPTPPAPHWANFAVLAPYRAPIDQALMAWEAAGLPEVARTVVQEAVQQLQAEGAKEIPAPHEREDKDENKAVRDALRALVRSLPKPPEDRLAKALAAQQRAAHPPPRAHSRVRGAAAPVNDPELSPRWDELQVRLEDIARRLALPTDLLQRAVGELFAGRHVLLVGPVGTGKTSLAVELCRALGMAPRVETASADWTAFEVVGGFFPHTIGSGSEARTEMRFRPGVFTAAVLANWEDGEAPWRRPSVGGTWLVLDEMNRADVDRALGPVFTALESRVLRVPDASVDQPSREIPVPADFRVIATLNAVDRHYLFRLSDALKRRFAFLEVPVTWDFNHEWRTIRERCQVAAHGAAGDLRRFVYLVRAFHPVGTAQLFAGARFLAACERSLLLEPARLAQAVQGSVLPGLEDAAPTLLELLSRWAAEETTEAIREALAGPEASAAAMDALRDALAKIDDGLLDEAEKEALRLDDPRPAIAATLRRRGPVVPTLSDKLAQMRRANEGLRAGP